MQTISLVRQHKVNGETLAYTEVVLCNGLVAVDIPVLGQTAKQAQPMSLTASLLQSVYIAANQPATVYVNGTAAVQTLTVTGSPTGGTFTVTGTTPAAWTTAAIAYNATAAQVAAAIQSAIVAVSGGALTTVTGAGGPLPASPAVLTFGGTLALMPVPPMTAAGSFTGGTSPSVAVASTTAGVNPAATFTLTAGQVIDWTAQDGVYACPITTNVTQLSVSNLNTASALVQCRIGTN